MARLLAWVGKHVLQIIKQYGLEGSFQPEDLLVLAAAFDEAWQRVEKTGIRFGSDYYRDQARNELGKYIIEEAKRGERDKARLCDTALLLYRQTSLHDPAG